MKSLFPSLLIAVFLFNQTVALAQSTQVELQTASLSHLLNNPEALLTASQRLEDQIDQNSLAFQQADEDYAADQSQGESRKAKRWTRLIMKRSGKLENVMATEIAKMSDTDAVQKIVEVKQSVQTLEAKSQAPAGDAVQKKLNEAFSNSDPTMAKAQLAQAFHEALPEIARQTGEKIAAAGGIFAYMIQAKAQMKELRSQVQASLHPKTANGRSIASVGLGGGFVGLLLAVIALTVLVTALIIGAAIIVPIISGVVLAGGLVLMFTASIPVDF